MSVPPFFVLPKNVFLSLGLPAAENTFYQLSPDDLIRQCNEKKEDVPNDTGSFINEAGNAVRIPKDLFIVKDDLTKNSVNWNTVNQPVEVKFFDGLYQKMIDHLSGKKIWIRDSYFFNEATNRIFIRSINEDPTADLFIYKSFLHPLQEELTNFNPDWYIIVAPSFAANPATDGIQQTGFIMANYAKKVILIGGLQYTAEIKEINFSILNFALLHGKKV